MKINTLPIKLRTTLLVVIALSVIVTLSVFALAQNRDASAANARDFDPGNIISDAVFYNSSAMTATQIQSFLNAKNTQCDTNGTGMAVEWGRSDISRATLASYIRNGTNGYTRDTAFHAPPYVCLKDFRQDTPQMPAASSLCGGITARTGATSAQIINDIARACGINPQVLLVLLQKEQSLVTDIWPLQRQYRGATGFACPDTAPCDPKYNGFFYQVYYAARQFKIYRLNANSYNYVSGRTNKIYWQTNLGEFINPTGNQNDPSRNGRSACGYQNVYIQNQATAGLYIYTPYQPNERAMANLYGTGDGCSAYGNRNFWRMFTDWFGNPKGVNIYFQGLKFTNKNPHANQPEKITFTVRNASRQTISLGRVKVEAISPSGRQLDLPSVTNTTIKPWEYFTYSQTGIFNEEGQWRIYISRNVDGVWLRPVFSDFGFMYDPVINVSLYKKPTMTSSLTISPSGSTSPHARQQLTATFTMRNNSATQPINVGRHKVQVHHSSGTQYDFASTPNDNVIQPGATYTYTATRSLPRTGSYTAFINNIRNGRWSQSYPESENSSIVRRVNLSVKPEVTMTESLNVSEKTTRAGEDVTATFTLRNFSNQSVNVGRLKVQTHHSDGTQYDFPSTPNNLTLAPGQAYAYSETRSLPKTGIYNVFVNNIKDGRWSQSYPASENSSITRKLAVLVKPAVSVTESLQLSATSASVGSNITATFKMTNYGTQPINVGRHKVQVHHSSGTQYDFASTPNDNVIQPGATYTYTATRSLPRTGSYTAFINNIRNGRWSQSYPESENSSIVRRVNLSVR